MISGIADKVALYRTGCRRDLRFWIYDLRLNGLIVIVNEEDQDARIIERYLDEQLDGLKQQVCCAQSAFSKARRARARGSMTRMDHLFRTTTWS